MYEHLNEFFLKMIWSQLLIFCVFLFTLPFTFDTRYITKHEKAVKISGVSLLVTIICRVLIEIWI